MKKKVEWIKRYYWKAKRERPWVIHLSWARSRCTSKNHPYFKKGIKVFLSVEEARRLWMRDGAWKMKQPSLDRINPKGNYTFKNCRFVEISKNRSAGGVTHAAMVRGKAA